MLEIKALNSSSESGIKGKGTLFQVLNNSTRVKRIFYKYRSVIRHKDMVNRSTIFQGVPSALIAGETWLKRE